MSGARAPIPEWSAGKIAHLRSEWLAGTPTAEIGRRIGRSKNSVIGKAHRLDLPCRPSPILRGVTPKRRAPNKRRSDIEWSTWQVERLRSEWAAGTHTARISQIVGRSTNAVIGKADRLDLPSRTSAYPARPSYGWRFASSVIQKAPRTPRPSVPTPTLVRPSSNELGSAGVGVRPSCQRVISESPERKLCGATCYTPPGADGPGEFCGYHFHFRNAS